MINPGAGGPNHNKAEFEDERHLGEPPVAPLLGEIIEDITRRLQFGEPVMIEEYIQRNPDYARPIRRLFPALQLMSSLRAKTVANRPKDGQGGAG